MGIFLDLIAALLIVAGLACAVLPLLPGIPLIFGGIWLAAGVDHYKHVSTGWLIGIAGIAAIGLLLDFVAGALGAKGVGASARAISGALIGTVVGLFLGIPGLVLGPFVGALLGELSSGTGFGALDARWSGRLDRPGLRHADQVGSVHHDGGAVRGGVVVESPSVKWGI